MEALLIINSLLVAICLYFIKDFHKDFKEVAKTVQEMKEKTNKESGEVYTAIKSVKRRVSKLEKGEAGK